MAEQLPLVLGHRVALGVEDFLVAESNRHAVEWIDIWPNWPFTALVVVGSPGCGKTHLASLWRARAGARTVDLIGSRHTTIQHAASIAASAGAAIIDDADRIMAESQAEIALLQLYNMLRAAKGHLLLTALRPPMEWNLGLPDLSSRLNSAMVVAIDPPDDALLASVALKLFADRQIAVGEGVISLLLSRGERSFAGVARAVEALDRASLAAKRSVTMALARQVLAGPL